MNALADFLLARIAEDEADAEHVEWDDHNPVHAASRIRAECEAKRQLVEYAEMQSTPDDEWLLILVQVYADHPDFREEWRA